MMYPPEFRALAHRLVYMGVPTYLIAKALGASTKTVWSWEVQIRGGRKLSRKGWARRRGDLLSQRWFKRGKIKYTIDRIGEYFQRLVRWMWYRDHEGGELDLDAVLAGEEPP